MVECSKNVEQADTHANERGISATNKIIDWRSIKASELGKQKTI